jgi:2-isopropylmalate synthase
MRVQGARALAVAEGEGPVDAMSKALRKALADSYPELTPVHLTDYKVRVLDPELGTAASVRVLVEHQDGSRTWNTVGVSTNIIEASWQALADGIRYHLLRTATPQAPVPEKEAPSSAHPAPY